MKCFLRLIVFAVCLATTASVRAQAFDVAVGLQVSKTAQLIAGDEILVSVTVSNLGPDVADNLAVAAGPAQEDGYLYLLIGADASSMCGPATEFETDPPQWGVFWDAPPIPVGGVLTCTARLRVAVVPSSHSATMHAGAHSNRDVDLADNFAQVALSFASISGAHRVPAGSWWAIVGTMVGIIVTLRAARRA